MGMIQSLHLELQENKVQILAKVNAKALKPGGHFILGGKAIENTKASQAKQNSILVSQANGSLSESHDFNNFELVFDYAVASKNQQ